MVLIMKKNTNQPGISVVYFCHDGQGHYLLNKRSINCRDEHGCWDPGAGAVEFGDKIEERLKKEIKEEYCADIIESEFLGFRDVHRIFDGQKSHRIALDFKVLVNPEQVKNGEPHKFDQIGWFTLDNLPQPLHSQIPIALKLYKEKL